MIDEVEKRHRTFVDAPDADETTPVLQVKAGDIWSDFIRVAPEREPQDAERTEGSVPLLDEMTGIRQWE